jgi:hypothetical protein
VAKLYNHINKHVELEYKAMLAKEIDVVQLIEISLLAGSHRNYQRYYQQLQLQRLYQTFFYI